MFHGTSNGLKKISSEILRNASSVVRLSNNGVLRRNVQQVTWNRIMLNRKIRPFHNSVRVTQTDILNDSSYRFKQSSTGRRSKIPKRIQIRLDNISGEIKYSENENEHFHKVLESDCKYEKYLLFKTQEKKLEIKTDELLEERLASLDSVPQNINSKLSLLEELGNSVNRVKDNFVSDCRFQSLCLELLSDVQTFSNEQLKLFMRHLGKFGFRDILSGENRQFRLNLFYGIQDECVHRHKTGDWGLHELLYAADFCYAMRVSAYRTATILDCLMNSVQNHIDGLSGPEIVLFMYHCNLARKIPHGQINKISEKILVHFDEMSFDEVAIVCLGLFKTNTPIYSPELVCRVARSLNLNLSATNPLAISAVFKELTKSTNKNTSKRVTEFRDLLGPLLDKSAILLSDLPFSAVTHIFRFFLDKHYISEAFMEQLLLLVLKDDVSKWRLKEVTRFLFNLANLPCCSTNENFHLVIEELIQELKKEARLAEMQLFPECLVQGLVGLSVINIYDEELTNRLFGEQHQLLLANHRKSLERVDFRRDLYQLDKSIQIDMPSYRGNRLPESFDTSSVDQLNISKPSSRRSNFTAIREVILQEVVTAMTSVLGGQQFLKVKHLLSHFQTPDIEIHLDHRRKPVPVDEWRKEKLITKVVSNTVDSDLTSILLELSNQQTDQQRIVVTVFGPNCYHVYRDKAGRTTKELLGLHEMKLRHLTATGFTVIQVPYFEFNAAVHKARYLEQKVNGSSQ